MLRYYSGSVAKALVHLYPDIGLHFYRFPQGERRGERERRGRGEERGRGRGRGEESRVERRGVREQERRERERR
jgi:hypothetical protein